MKKQDAEIRIDYVGRRGDGVGEWEGKPVFVPRALPGENVRVRLYEDREQGIAGQLLEVREKSAQRIAPLCPYYDSCGGCALQHWEEQSYRAWKQQRLIDLLAKNGLCPREIRPAIFIPHATRRRATLAAVLENGRLRLGYHRARSHDVADIPRCLLLTAPVQAAADAMRPYLARLLMPNKPADIFVQECDGAVDVMITGGREPRYEELETMAEMAQEAGLARLARRRDERDEAEVIVQYKPVIKRSGALAVELPPGAFLQPSAEGETALVNAVLSPLGDAETIADLFSGCGTFTGPLMAKGKVFAAESDGAAIAALKKSSRGIEAAKRNLYADPLTAKELARFDAVIMDPPRMGAKEQAGEIAHSDVDLVVSVSCNPATFARDAKILCGGGYEFESVQLIDQFVWSSHAEMAGIFRR